MSVKNERNVNDVLVQGKGTVSGQHRRFLQESLSARLSRLHLVCQISPLERYATTASQGVSLSSGVLSVGLHTLLSHTACQRRAWPEHKRECSSLRSLLPRMPSDSVRLAARIIFRLLDPSPGSSEELYSLEEHETHLGVMSEEKREGLTQLGSVLQLYLQQEVPALSQEATSPLPPGLDPLSLLARVSYTHSHTLTHTHMLSHTHKQTNTQSWKILNIA
ncbi:histone-lysine N-methyltransferase SMYD3 [Hypomesus transpacificus]|uniref:histone-lysine N-methyltransferase SMYD3 n=1 Tax=Hypomesus transpacificus TaxID=137520 RepID=UPI001F085CB5|nr:histone-lysine N-methyltransferase SMYD3 [Hypomesus transpacificus]